MKIAGTGQLTKTFLKEEASGRGATFNPHGDDDRFENLDETADKDADDVKEEGLTEEAELEQEGQELEQEAKSLVGKKPTKMKGAGGDQKLKPAKTSSKNSVKEGLDDLDAAGAEGGDAPPVEMEPEAGMEPDGDEGGAGGPVDVSSLVRAIAAAISAERSVQVDVEGAGGEEGEELPPEGEEPGLEGGEGEAALDDKSVPDMMEAGMVGYKTEDMAAKKAPTGVVAETKKTKTSKDVLVAEITNKVMARLAEAVKKKGQKTVVKTAPKK